MGTVPVLESRACTWGVDGVTEEGASAALLLLSEKEKVENGADSLIRIRV